MKNRIYLSIISAILLFSVIFVACKKQEEATETENVSYSQTTLFTGSNDTFNVSLSSGISEKLFIADGKTTDVGNFVLLKVTPLSPDLLNVELKYKLVGDKGETTDSLSKDAFGAYLSAEPDLNVIGNPLCIYLINGEKETQIELKDEMQDRISSAQALQIAKEKIKDKLEADDKDRETYVRLINNAENKDSAYYWYVAFIASPTDYYSVLIDGKGTVITTSPQN